LQLGFGDSAAESGLITFASAAGSLVMKPTATFVIRRFGFRRTLVVNGVISVITLAVSVNLPGG
ncbi:MAG: MFS transporter, partial [Acetobacteraceae bacterium]